MGFPWSQWRVLRDRSKTRSGAFADGVNVYAPNSKNGNSTSLGRWSIIRKRVSQEDARKHFRNLLRSGKTGRPVPTAIEKLVVQIDTSFFVSETAKTHPDVDSYLSKMAQRLEGPIVYYTDEVMIGQFRAEARVQRAGSNRQSSSETYKMLTNLFADVVGKGSSDLHIYVGEDSTQLHVRLHGDKLRYTTWGAERGNQALQGLHTAGFDKAINLSKKYASSARISEGKISLPAGIEGVRIQFNPSKHQDMYAVLRFLGAGAADAMTLGDLGYEKVHLATYGEIMEFSDGIMLVTGPTGSGKSKTLKHYVAELYDFYDEKINIITVEDPIEYTIDGAVQTAVPQGENEEETKANYAKALKAILRNDPDCIMPSEIRDAPTAQIAFEAALTGHMVKSTLHVNSALEVPQRLLAMKIDPSMVFSSSLSRGWVAQRLIKVLCPDCSLGYDEVKDQLSDVMINRLAPMRASGHDIRFRHEKGNTCKTCNGTGIKGRTVAAEIMRPDRAIMGALAEMNTESLYNAEKLWFERGGFTMMEHAVIKMCRGIASPFDVQRVDPIDVSPNRMKFLETLV